jgi:uncharacterized protein YdeI (YjbR/CyaY-like superfamily)
MGKRSKKVDAYIQSAAPFAQPILRKLRELFHRGWPEIVETIKWGKPTFDHKGIVGGMAAFKNHVSWGLWRGAELKDKQSALAREERSIMSGGKVTEVSQLPPDKAVVDLVRQAAELNASGVKRPPVRRVARPLGKVPRALASALRRNPAAAKAFKAFSASHQREYIEWVGEAKQQATRERRAAQAIEWLAKGKSRNWKYEKR